MTLHEPISTLSLGVGDAGASLAAASNPIKRAWDHLWFYGNTDASNFAGGSDAVFFFIFWVSAFFFVLLMFLMVVFAVRYRRVPGKPAPYSPSHNTPLEIFWSVVPTILLAVMFFWGLIEYLPTRVAPGGAEEIQVTAQQWAWSWVYDNGASPLNTEVIANMEAPIYALPVNKPVKFTMSSEDVIHSFYIPAFRIKRDVMPNMYTHVWAEPTKVSHEWNEDTEEWRVVPEMERGDFNGFYLACTEYCGDQHSQMWGRVMVLSQGDYERWKEQQADTSSIPLVELGEQLHKSKGCVACHSVDGSSGTGPTWQGIWGKPHQFADGSSIDAVDENYIRESILEPAAKIVAGYPNQMASYQGQLTDRELYAIVKFIQSLSDDPSDVEAAEQESAQEIQQQSEGDAAGDGAGGDGA